MEENENEIRNSKQFTSTSTTTTTFSHSNPLFSTLITLYILILLYFPHLFFKLSFSPVLILTLTLLLTLLRLGATQSQRREEETETTQNHHRNCTTSVEADRISDSNFHDQQDHKWVTSTETNSFNPDPRFEDSFVEWNVRAPLDVIYEAYEEGEEEEGANKDQDQTRFGIDRYPSLSLCYPESDSDTSSEGDFPAIGEWGSPEKWEDEDREGLIEIALDGDNSSNSNNYKRDFDFDFEGNFHGEEEKNMIEIDISSRKMSLLS